MSTVSEALKHLDITGLTKRELREAIADLADQVGEDELVLAEMTAAAHMLHEQAHDSSWVNCAFDPCKHLDNRVNGPAQRTMITGHIV